MCVCMAVKGSLFFFCSFIGLLAPLGTGEDHEGLGVVGTGAVVVVVWEGVSGDGAGR